MTRAVLRKDLASLWVSSVPYIVAALFHLVLGVLYVNQLEARDQAVFQPLVPIAGFLLVLTVPLITMRTLSDEARTGTLDVLQAIPVRTGPLVAGKWLAAWLTVVGILAPLGVTVALVSWFGDPDAGPVIGGLVGLVLLAGTLCGIGVLASSLTSSQPVAAMASLFVTLLVWFAHVGSESLSAGSVLARLSLSERLRLFAGGAIDSGDVVYLVAVAVAASAMAALAVDARTLR